jgi:hypothetical protein
MFFLSTNDYQSSGKAVIQIFLSPSSELLKFDRFQSRLRLSNVTNALRARCSWLVAASPTNNN